MSDKKQPIYILLSWIGLLACGQPATKPSPAPASTNDTTVVSGKTILFFGNSLTAGYGLASPALAFPGLIQDKLDSLHLPYHVVNAGNSGETSAGGLGRIDWVLKQRVDIFLLELGANDGLRGIPVSETQQNLQAIIDKVKKTYPGCQLVLLGMQVPPNLGLAYTTAFKAMYPGLARANKMTLVPFLLQGVAGISALNQPDGIHPTAEGDKIVAWNVWSVLKGLL